MGLRMLAALLVVAPLAGNAGAQTAWFVVGRPDAYPFGGDSYILPLDDPAAIATARAIAAGGGVGGPIVIATVGPGDGGYNRDVLRDPDHRWSWHVVAFEEFAEMAIELCDGSPTLTEGGAPGWPPGFETTICYWSYSIVAEIDDPTPVGTRAWGAVKSLYRAHRP